MSQDLAEIILKTLDHEDPNILRAACCMCGRMKLAQAERGLLKALGHKVWQVRAEAAKALGRIGSKGAVPYLRRILGAGEQELRQRMLAAASGTAQPKEGDETPPELLRQVAMALNRLMPSVAQDALLAALNSGQTSLIGAALAGLTNLDSDLGRDKIRDLLGHEDPAVRRAAATSCGKLIIADATEKLMALLEDADATVRREAAIALNNLKDSRAIPALAPLTQDKSPEVRRVAVIALGNTRTRDQQVVTPLIRALRDREAAVRRAALSALGNLRAGQSLDEVALLLDDSHEEVRKQAGATVVALAMAQDRPDYD